MRKTNRAFRLELDRLIEKHASKNRWAEDFFPILDELEAAADRTAVKPDGYRFRDDETEEEFKKRMGQPASRVAAR